MYRGKGHGKRPQGGVEYTEDSGYIAGKQELDSMADIAVYVSAVGYSLDNCGKIVVSKDHGGSILGDLSSGDAHGDADVRLL